MVRLIMIRTGLKKNGSNRIIRSYEYNEFNKNAIVSIARNDLKNIIYDNYDHTNADYYKLKKTDRRFRIVFRGLDSIIIMKEHTMRNPSEKIFLVHLDDEKIRDQNFFDSLERKKGEIQDKINFYNDIINSQEEQLKISKDLEVDEIVINNINNNIELYKKFIINLKDELITLSKL